MTAGLTPAREGSWGAAIHCRVTSRPKQLLRTVLQKSALVEEHLTGCEVCLVLLAVMSLQPKTDAPLTERPPTAVRAVLLPWYYMSGGYLAWLPTNVRRTERGA